MKKEYNFSKAEQGKFYRPGRMLDREVEEDGKEPFMAIKGSFLLGAGAHSIPRMRS